MAKVEKITAHFPVLQSEAQAAIDATQAFVDHAITIRDYISTYRVEPEQAKRIAARLRHAASIAEQLADHK